MNKSLFDIIGFTILLGSAILCLLISLHIMYYGEITLVESNKLIILFEVLFGIFGVVYGFIILYNRKINYEDITLDNRERWQNKLMFIR